MALYDVDWGLARLRLVEKELEPAGIFMAHGAGHACGRWIDLTWDEVEKSISEKTNTDVDVVMERISFVFSPYINLQKSAKTGLLFLQHNILTGDRKIVEAAFRKHFNETELDFPQEEDQCIAINLPPKTVAIPSITTFNAFSALEGTDRGCKGNGS